jgi:23S rRNA pseudouridine2605 synthase
MSKAGNFKKFIQKKKNSVIKEEFRKEKKEWKKELTAKKLAKKKVIKAKAHAQLAPEKSQSPEAIKGAIPLNKFISHSGICSRRDAAELVKAGKVQVDGKLVTEPGFKVTSSQEVKVNGKKITLQKNLVYILLNKPKDFITTTTDPHGRHTVLELIKHATKERVYPVGRLDRNTTGVLLLTNDGELTQKLSHPSYEVKKVYEVRLDRPLIKKDFDTILKGIELEDGMVSPDALAYADTKDKSVIGIEIHSGRNRIVRRIFEHLGYDVKNLDRVMYANLTKKNVERGKWRFLSEKEVRLLKYMNTSIKKHPSHS